MIQIVACMKCVYSYMYETPPLLGIRSFVLLSKSLSTIVLDFDSRFSTTVCSRGKIEIFFSRMNNGIQSRFSLLYSIFNKVQFRIFLCINIMKWRCYASLKKTIFLNGSAAGSISAEVFNLERTQKTRYNLPPAYLLSEARLWKYNISTYQIFCILFLNTLTTF